MLISQTLGHPVTEQMAREIISSFRLTYILAQLCLQEANNIIIHLLFHSPTATIVHIHKTTGPLPHSTFPGTRHYKALSLGPPLQLLALFRS